jgi:predicted nucleic acid-binding protein
MNGNDFLVDTNVLIYLQNGVAGIDKILGGKDIYVSYITEMELLSFPKLSKEQLHALELLLDDCFIIDMNQEIKELAIELRRTEKLKLPDAIIAASSIAFNLPIITADKQFSKIKVLDIIVVDV